MSNPISEASYPSTFRKVDTEKLIAHLKNRHSVLLLGMKRVGIGNFLRFFLNNESVSAELNASQKHVLISVDLNDLVEREIYAFWMLTFKRIIDTIQSSSLRSETKKTAEALFVSSIQSKELFFLIDGIRTTLKLILEEGYLPTLFFIRFDRIKSVITDEFFANFVGLEDSLNNQLSYVFTSYRNLHDLAPAIFTKPEVAAFVQTQSIKPASIQDASIVFQELKRQYTLTLTPSVEKYILSTSGGHLQYLYLQTLITHEHPAFSQEQLEKIFLTDERIQLLSEEIWESLLENEKNALITALFDDEKLSYLTRTGIVIQKDGHNQIFNPLFKAYITTQHKKEAEEKQPIELSKKELLLYTFLEKNIDTICERDAIIQAVWPEEEAFGISDWAIDRLVSRVRQKLRLQESQYEIITVKTRGYKLSLKG